jgi:hypothetical protein
MRAFCKPSRKKALHRAYRLEDAHRFAVGDSDDDVGTVGDVLEHGLRGSPELVDLHPRTLARSAVT